MVFTVAFNRPDFIVRQQQLFERFLQDDYEFSVVSDAVECHGEIKATCAALGLAHHRVPPEIHDRPYLHRSPADNLHNPNVRHCNSVQWAWDSIFSHHDGPVMIVDSDLFLIRPFSVASALEGLHLAGVRWGTTDMATGAPYSYLWLALVLLNNPLMPDRDAICFNCGCLPGTEAVCDSGGWTSLYLQRYADVLEVGSLGYLQGHEFYCPFRYGPPGSERPFDGLSATEIAAALTARGFTPAEVDLALSRPDTIELLADNHFLHYRAGTNYENYSAQFLAEKDRVLETFFAAILA
jgi:hypothetical protein